MSYFIVQRSLTEDGNRVLSVFDNFGDASIYATNYFERYTKSDICLEVWISEVEYPGDTPSLIWNKATEGFYNR